MAERRKVEVFSAGCGVCNEVLEQVKRLACSCCEVVALDMHEPQVAERAKELGVQRVPAVAVDGALVSCCAGGGIDEAALRAAGIGEPLPS